MKKFQYLFLSLLAVGIFAISFSATVLASDGTVSGYAWSDNIGWINFNINNENTATISDSGLSGYAWNENTGRINLDTGQAGWGVKNDGQGNLSGYAWDEGTGKIDFTGVVINATTGVFSGTALGDNGVNINFSCDHCNVTTDWRPTSQNTNTNESHAPGGYVSNVTPPAAPAGGFQIQIDNGAKETNNMIATLSFNAGSDVALMEVSTSADFAGAILEKYAQTKSVALSSGDGVKTFYARFFNSLGGFSSPVSSSIILDTGLPNITVTQPKSSYASNEPVVLSGATKSNAQIIALIDGTQYASAYADNSGNWSMTLPPLAVGSHQAQLYAKDLAGNISSTIAATFSVAATVTITQPSIISNIIKQLPPVVSQILQPAATPPIVVTVPKQPQVALNGQWNILNPQPIASFVLSPLPPDIAVLSQKFPQLQTTLNQLGISSSSNLQKINSVDLQLPNLSEAVGLVGTDMPLNSFTPPENVPIEQLSGIAKSNIPSNIVFSKAAGGTVDLNTNLSVDTQGQLQSSITTTAGQTVQYIVRTDQPVNNVKGYIILQSPTLSDATQSFSLKDLTASLTFANPTFTQTQLEPIAGNPALILSTFDYHSIGAGVYVANVATPSARGQYQVVTVMDYQDSSSPSQSISLINVVDPEGYVYQQYGNKQIRIPNAVVSLYWLNPATKKYELWPSKKYQQNNPQTTDVSGSYSFIAPVGSYYIKVASQGYISYQGKPFQATQGKGINVNIALKTPFWWLNPLNWNL